MEKYLVKNSEGKYWKECEYPTQKREERWGSKSEAFIHFTKKDAQSTICLAYLRDAKIVKLIRKKKKNGKHQ